LAEFDQVMYFTPVRRALVASMAAVVAIVIATGPMSGTPAAADTSGQLTAQVQQLLTKVHALQAKANAAEKRYSKAFNAVADSVNVAITADQTSSELTGNAQEAQATLVNRVRALYESGGQAAAYASVLASGNLTELYDRNELASRAVTAQVANVHAADQAAQAAVIAARADVKREHLKIGTERTIAAAAMRVQLLLNQESALLKHADKRLAAVRKAEAALAAEAASFSSITASSIAGLHILPPSAEYLALYKGAATTCPGLSWTILASIGQVESGHGRDTATSSAGAMGPMQFLPATFAAYGVDGNHDGVIDIMNPADAIYTAAHYLCANGAGRSPGALNGAILHYNHAVWYLEMILKLAGMYASAYG
jgi:soluble lytic murein transglycosylase-like protein